MKVLKISSLKPVTISSKNCDGDDYSTLAIKQQSIYKLNLLDF